MNQTPEHIEALNDVEQTGRRFDAAMATLRDELNKPFGYVPDSAGVLNAARDAVEWWEAMT